MPTYDYQCNECGGEFEAFQSMKDAHLTDCQLCDASGSIKRKIGLGAGIIFKGSGFYETDFKDKKGQKSGDEAKPAAKGSSEKTEASSGDAKTGKKTEVKASASTKSSD